MSSRRLLGAARAQEGDRVTTLELFFDLVYAFAFTQVTSLMLHGGPPVSLLQGFVVLALLWWSWVSYTWLANVARADQGLLQAAFIVATVAMFLCALVIPDAFAAHHRGLSAAAILVASYGLVRVVHIGAYAVVSRDDPALHRQVLITALTSVVPNVGLLVAGAAIGGNEQVWIWLVAMLYDFTVIFVAAIGGGGWAVRSAAHFVERHALVVLLALGESIVAAGSGIDTSRLTWSTLVGSVLAVAVAFGLWAAYFGWQLELLEHRLSAAHGQRRAKLAREVFTYLHLPLIAGIILTARSASRRR